LILFKAERKHPLPSLGFKSSCIKCGHCVSVCPVSALALAGLEPESCQPIEAQGAPASPAQLELFLKSRRSIRLFKPDPLPDETLKKLFEIADYAPTGLNRRQVRWQLFSKPEDVKRLAALVVGFMKDLLAESPEQGASLALDKIVKAWELGADPIMRGAPQLAVAHAPGSDGMAQTSGDIALEYLELAAHALGAGACWAGYFHFAAIRRYKPLLDFLALPEGDAVLGGMMLGSPALTYKRLPLRPPLQVSWR
jgi:nitroreductase